MNKQKEVISGLQQDIKEEILMINQGLIGANQTMMEWHCLTVLNFGILQLMKFTLNYIFNYKNLIINFKILLNINI